MSEIDHITISTDLLQMVSADQAWHYGILPKAANNGNIEFYIDVLKCNETIKDDLEVLFGKIITLEKTPSPIVQKSLSLYYRKGKGKTGEETLSVNGRLSDDFLFRLISEANSINSSDIHIETYEENCRIRLRIDGKLVERYVIKKDEYPSLVNKIKIKSNLDIAEKRLPQDGRIFFNTGKDKFDIRVSVLPSLYGEKIVLRLLSKDSTNVDITSLGFNAQQLEDYYEGIKKPHGIILISGPTGSGKTTTLYATLKILNKENVNILTIEDPIEYTLDGVNQVQLKESIGLTFASALRTFLRQDPDIIMLGEIRDNETAQMAIRAALTGHLVLSTIHTNSAWGTISRLIDMEVPSFLLANTLSLSVAQRLVRVLCPHCKTQVPYDSSLLPKSFVLPRKLETLYTATGCEKCYYTGYRGRRAVYEVITMDYNLSERIKAGDMNVGSLLKEKGILRLSDSAFNLLEQGLTTAEEVYPILMTTI
ncbi:MAG: type II/IV secretion system protein [Bacteroidia bacterium]|nr:type II/IV secretion system protein [Bacteroidia bacterium]